MYQHKPYNPDQEKMFDERHAAGLEVQKMESHLIPSEANTSEQSSPLRNTAAKQSPLQPRPFRSFRSQRLWLITSLITVATVATVVAIVTGVLLVKDRIENRGR